MPTDVSDPGGGLARRCILLFLLAAAVRLSAIVCLDLPRWGAEGVPLAPHWEMERAAYSVATTGVIGNVFSDDSGPSAHVAPAYALILGGIYRLVGLDPVRMRLAQEAFAAVVSSLAIALLPAVGWRAGLRPVAGLAAGLFLALVPIYLREEIGGDWEQPLAGLTLLVALLDAEARRRDGWRLGPRTVGSGLLFGWAALLSPPVLIAAVLMRVGLCLQVEGSRSRIARSLIVEALVVAAVLAPWVLRNQRDLGGFIPLRSNMGLELDVGNHDGAIGFGGLPQMRRHPATSAEELAEYRSLGERRYMQAKMRSALDWIGSHPAGFAALCVRRAYLFWFTTNIFWLGTSGYGPTMARVMTAYATTISLLAFAGLVGLFRRRQPSRWTLAAALIVPSLVYCVAHILPRYRYTVYNLEVLLAMDFALAYLRAIRGWPSPRRISASRAGPVDPDAGPIAPDAPPS